MYGLVGVFGAARFGSDTAGDILVNTWLGGRAEGFLDAAVTCYLAISIPPVQASVPACRLAELPTWWPPERSSGDLPGNVFVAWRE